ncbi:MAG: hypothetical protein HKN70_01780 [Gammaproteobacteria bacterium]|nr:hypothetical protein [Gammaproteobacteria bacterium]
MNENVLSKVMVACCSVACFVPVVLAEQPVTAPAASQTAGLQLRTTAVTGSRELPKVLVIVPWKSAAAPGPGSRPLASLVEETLTPLDPAVFRRTLSYYSKLNSEATTDESSAQKPEN